MIDPLKQFKTGDYTADLQAIGQRLQQQRESRQLTREMVAQELKLHLNIVTALEEGDMQHLPGPTFIMGYLRSYARLMEIPTEEVTLYSVHEVERSARLRSSSSLNNRPLDSGRSRRLFLTLLVIALLVATAFWWFTQPTSPLNNFLNSTTTNNTLLPPGPQMLEDTMLPRLDQMNEVKPELVDVEGSFSALPAPPPATPVKTDPPPLYQADCSPRGCHHRRPYAGSQGATLALNATQTGTGGYPTDTGCHTDYPTGCSYRASS